MALKACPRCRKLIPHGLPYCEACAPLAAAEREAKRERRAEYMAKKYNRQYNARRDPKYLTFYRSKAWKETSRAKLSQAGYKCEARLPGCTRLAVEVHHTEPIQTPAGWDHRLDWSNLEAVCTACHNGRHPEKFKRRADPSVLDMREIIKKL
jgi:5-methylcytosine-specific restriction endonuclease McrA